MKLAAILVLSLIAALPARAETEAQPWALSKADQIESQQVQDENRLYYDGLLQKQGEGNVMMDQGGRGYAACLANCQLQADAQKNMACPQACHAQFFPNMAKGCVGTAYNRDTKYYVAGNYASDGRGLPSTSAENCVGTTYGGALGPEALPPLQTRRKSPVTEDVDPKRGPATINGSAKTSDRAAMDNVRAGAKLSEDDRKAIAARLDTMFQ